jgi:glutathione reductase (NADPH)
MPRYDYDLCVIGAGSGGVRASRMAARYGARVLVAEDRDLGGTCVNVGCVPKKLFVYGSHFAEDFEDARAYGWDASRPTLDWPRLRDNKTREVRRLNGVYAKLLETAGATLSRERATILDAHTVRIGSTNVSTERLLVATGSAPFVPDFAGREHVVTSDDMFYLEALPERAVVVGGGYIAVEFAGILQGLGVPTMLLYRGEQILRGFDPSVRDFVAEQLREKGIDVRCRVSVVRIDRGADDTRHVRLDSGEVLDVGLVLFATGRRPNTAGLGLDRIGVATSATGGVCVDAEYRTNVANVYALGDVIERVQLTPVAIAEAMCLTENLYNGGARRIDYESIPTAVFCQPNIGAVGLTEDVARARFRDIRVFETRFKPMKHTLTGRDERTLMKLIVRVADDRVVGVHMVGPDAGEIVQGLAVALTAGATKAQFDATIGIHPTAAEEFVTLREPVR